MNRYFLIIAFLLGILLPIINDVFSIMEFPREAENRRFQDTLTFDIKRLDNFPKDCEAYINDNFAFRTPSINLYRKIKSFFFDVAPTDKETVLIGKNKRYFIAGEEKKLFEGEATLSQAQLDSFQNEWNRRNAIYQKNHIQTFWLIAPSALEIHDRELPENVQKLNTLNATLQFVERMNQKNAGLVSYPAKLLRQLAVSNNLYFKMDNHWNEAGAYYAMQSFFQGMKLRMPSFNGSFMNDTIHVLKTKKGGYLADQLHMSHKRELYMAIQLRSPQAVKSPKFNFPVTEGFPYPDDFEQYYKNDHAKNKKKVLVIRDSFGSDCIPFIAEAFSESLFIFDGWKYGMNTNILEAYKPDIVIYITYEPHLINFIRR